MYHNKAGLNSTSTTMSMMCFINHKYDSVPKGEQEGDVNHWMNCKYLLFEITSACKIIGVSSEHVADTVEIKEKFWI